MQISCETGTAPAEKEVRRGDITGNLFEQRIRGIREWLGSRLESLPAKRKFSTSRVGRMIVKRWGLYNHSWLTREDRARPSRITNQKKDSAGSDHRILIKEPLWFWKGEIQDQSAARRGSFPLPACFSPLYPFRLGHPRFGFPRRVSPFGEGVPHGPQPRASLAGRHFLRRALPFLPEPEPCAFQVIQYQANGHFRGARDIPVFRTVLPGRNRMAIWHVPCGGCFQDTTPTHPGG